MKCPSCSAELPLPARFCPACGETISSASQFPTALSPDPDAAARRGRVSSSGVGRISSATVEEGAFTPGMVLGERYRIIGLLGRGGMGEVYRADDLKLGQPVALKFLPPTLEADPSVFERFLGEVRLARQVSHPNVCRVYDIGEIGGRHFLSMEYVDGEDLASLLKRIGRLGGEKALEIARQLCAGLAAAHDRGVLHRDLKPANVMLDGRGRVRITDFGLAVTAGEGGGGGEIVGTPAYMAPEQLAGKGASVQSDLYALGLVLYELFTGKRAFEAVTVADWKRKHTSERPENPSTHTREIDPIVEAVILRCIEKEPRARPRSALAVAASLPGGDPLAAALAAGETPSPEMVAAAGELGALSPAAAWAALLWIVAGIVAIAVLAPRSALYGRVPLEKSTDALGERSREIARNLGYPARPRGQADSFEENSAYLEWVAENDRSPGRWRDLEDGRPAAIFFLHRQSPEPLRPQRYPKSEIIQGFVTADDPPPLTPGMITVELDPLGRLIRFHAVPPASDASLPAVVTPDWQALFREAGLEPARFQAVTPERVPPDFADSRMAWQETAPERAGRPLRVEAAAFRGKVVFFELLGPWNRSGASPARGPSAVELVGVALFLAVVVSSVLLARRNVRKGRGDRSGALRVALWMLATFLFAWALVGEHVPTTAEFGQFILGTSWALFLSVLVWLMYLALEPIVRRRWPDALISWTRLVSGNVRDPLVGRAILVGGALGVVEVLVLEAGWFAETKLAAVPPRPMFAFLFPLGSLRMVVGDILIAPAIAAIGSIALFFVLFLLRLLLRNGWLAAGVVVALGGSIEFLTNGPFAAATTVLQLVAEIFVLMRFGLLANIVATYFAHFLLFPINLDLTTWYAGPTLFALVALVGLAIFGFRIALAGRPAFGRLKLDD